MELGHSKQVSQLLDASMFRHGDPTTELPYDRPKLLSLLWDVCLRTIAPTKCVKTTSKFPVTQLNKQSCFSIESKNLLPPLELEFDRASRPRRRTGRRLCYSPPSFTREPLNVRAYPTIYFPYETVEENHQNVLGPFAPTEAWELHYASRDDRPVSRSAPLYSRKIKSIECVSIDLEIASLFIYKCPDKKQQQHYYQL